MPKQYEGDFIFKSFSWLTIWVKDFYVHIKTYVYIKKMFWI